MSLAPAALIPVDAYKFIFIGTGQPHDLMALIELEKEFTQYLEALKQTVEDRFDEYSALVKETTLSLSQRDAETENSVVALHNARDEQVSSSEGLSLCGCKRYFSIIIIALILLLGYFSTFEKVTLRSFIG